MEVEALSDAELRGKLIQYGVNVGPVTGSTRTIYEKKLKKLLQGPTATARPKTPTTISSSTTSSSRRTTSTRKTGSRRLERSEIEDESDTEDRVVSPRPQSAKSTSRKPVTSTPTKDPSPPPSPRKPITPSKPANDIIPGLRSALPPPSTDVFTSRIDRPGATPPRKTRVGAGTPVRTTTTITSSYVSPTLSSSDYSFRRTANKSRSFLDTGNTTGEEDSDDGIETSRIVYDVKKDKPSPLRAAWDKMLGNDFHVGSPGTRYEMRHGLTKTRVDRDPKTGRVRVKQQNMLGDVPRILVIVLAVFAALLGVLYLFMAKPEAIAATSKTIAGAARDTVAFFYLYAVVPIIVIGVAAVAVLAIYFGQKYYRESAKKEQELFEQLIDNIIDKVKETSESGERFVAVPHVRDIMFPPARRTKNEAARWERAVDFINDNESRIGTETKIIRGQECSVWRWLPLKTSGWQGSAFTTNLRTSPNKLLSPNVPPEALTCSLKVRGVFEDRSDKDEDDEIDYDLLEDSIREKIAPVRPLHISFDKGSTEGICYMKLANKADAKAAFTALHAIWFNGRLVSVKYIRDSRYIERFPEAARL